MDGPLTAAAPTRAKVNGVPGWARLVYVEKRKQKRYPKRFRVRYGEKGWPYTGFVSDISASGMFIVGANAPKIGTRLHLEVALESDRLVYFEGVVQRLAVVPPELRQVVKSGFGVRLLTGAELLLEMLPSLKENRLKLRYETLEVFTTAFDKELHRGGLFVRTSRLFPQNTVVGIELDLTFAGRSLELQARVVHVIPEPGGTFGTSLVFVDPPEAVVELKKLIPGRE